jgi:hypothetical protein
MDAGFRSPLIDFFKRGEVARDVRLMAAEGTFAPRAHATLDSLPATPLQAFLARSDVPDQMRDFFAARGTRPADQAASTADVPLVESAAGADEPADDTDEADGAQVLASLPIVERMKLAMKGTKGQRAQLIRDSNKLVAAAVLSSPKLTESEVEAFAKMANVSEDVLRTIATNRTWVKNYGVVAGLTRNPKTPPGISMQMVQRLNERDLKMLAIDRNVPEGVRLAARKFVRPK